MNTPVRTDNDLLKKIKWLMFFRVLFTVFLLGSTIIVQYGQQLSSPNPQLVLLYGINAVVLVLSIGYAVILRYDIYIPALAYLQIILDTVIVSLIVFATGCYSSIFSFIIPSGHRLLQLASFPERQHAHRRLVEYSVWPDG